MKKIFLPATVVIVFCTAWMLYLQWDTERFIESLPKAASRTSGMMPQERTAENENSGTLPPENVSENNEPSAKDPALPDFTENLNPPDAIHREMVSRNHDDVYGLDVKHVTEVKKGTGEGDQNKRPPVMALSVEQIIENNRRMLIEKHGNIPEIDIYLHYMKPVFEGMKEGKRQVRIDRTPEEELEFSRVQSVLFPSEDHLKHYQDVLKTTQELKRRSEMK